MLSSFWSKASPTVNRLQLRICQTDHFLLPTSLRALACNFVPYSPYPRMNETTISNLRNYGITERCNHMLPGSDNLVTFRLLAFE
jgi:hypothetical protein